MFNLSNNSNTKYHRFQYHARIYDEKKDLLEKRRANLKLKMQDESYDVIEEYKKRRLKKKSPLITISYILIFISILFYFDTIENYLERKYKYGAIGMYFLLILLGLIFLKRSKKRNA